MKDYRSLIGKTIKIIELDDPYEKGCGKTGVVVHVGEDPWGDTYLKGTWGGLVIYPEKDKFEVVKDREPYILSGEENGLPQ